MDNNGFLVFFFAKFGANIGQNLLFTWSSNVGMYNVSNHYATHIQGCKHEVNVDNFTCYDIVERMWQGHRSYVLSDEPSCTFEILDLNVKDHVVFDKLETM